MTRPILPAILLATTFLAACASDRPAQFAYEDAVPPLPSPPVTAPDDRPRPLHVPPAWTPSRGGEAAATPAAAAAALMAARRVIPWSGDSGVPHGGIRPLIPSLYILAAVTKSPTSQTGAPCQ